MPARAICRQCGVERFVCTMRTCKICHPQRRDRRTEGRAVYLPAPPDAIELCCGWWGPPLSTPWTCLTCGRVLNDCAKNSGKSLAEHQGTP